MPRVSIVVPSYNNERFIATTLQALLAQTYGDIEVLVADHSSSDETEAIISRFSGDRRVTLLRTAAGGGPERNWNRVSRAASGELLKLVCGDDVLHPDGLRAQVEALDAASSAVMVSSRRRIVTESGTPLLAGRGLTGMRGVVDGLEAIRMMVRAGSNLLGEPVCALMRRASLESVGWWDARFPFVIDQATYVRVLGTGSLVALPEVVADFRVSPGQLSVALAKHQYQQVAGFHRWVADAYPGSVSPVDVRIGNARALRVAAGRRAAYWWLSHGRG